MLRRTLTAGLFLVLAAMFIFVGCSDDSNPNNANIGDPNAPAFQPMKAAISTAVDSTLGVALKFAYKPNRYPSDSDWDRPELGPNDSLLYNYVGGWHVLYLGLSASVDYNFTYTDSARFWQGETAVRQFSPDRCTGLDLIHHQNSSYKGTGDEYTDLSTYVNVSFRNRLQSSQYFYGHTHIVLDDYYVVANEQLNTNYDFELTANDVTYSLADQGSWSSAHVTGGQLIISVVVDNGTDLVEWDIDVNFSETGSAMVEATDGVKTYEFTVTPQYQ